MMIDKHKRLLPPCDKGFTTHLESMYNTSFTLVGTSGLAPCRLGVPRPMSFYMSKLSSSISFHINKGVPRFTTAKTRATNLFLIILIIAILDFPSACLLM